MAVLCRRAGGQCLPPGALGLTIYSRTITKAHNQDSERLENFRPPAPTPKQNFDPHYNVGPGAIRPAV